MRALSVLLVIFLAIALANGSEEAAEANAGGEAQSAGGEAQSAGGEEQALAPRAVTIDAAFRYDGQLFFISGDEYMAITDQGFEEWVRKRGGETHVPVSAPITAAVTWPGKTRIYYWSNDRLFRVEQPKRILKEVPYGRDRQFMVPGGPDATSFKNGWSYVFKGCEYVKQLHTLWHLSDNREKLSDVGLPCDLDAAWIDEDFKGMTLLKGDLIWHWGETVTGPEPFAKHYHIWSWQLLPHPDNRFEL